MRKSLSLLLSGTMALGLATHSDAAPLARWNGSQQASAEETTRTVAKSENRSFQLSGISRQLPSAANTPLAEVASPTVTRNRKALRSATAASRVSSKLDIFGTVIYNNNWTTSNAPIGIYSLPLAEGQEFSLKTLTSASDIRYSVFDGENTVYVMAAVEFYGWLMGVDIYAYDTETWQQTGYIEADASILATDAAYDVTTGKIYGCFTDGESYRYWASAEISAAPFTPIANMPVNLRGVVISKQGQAYGISSTGMLYKIEKETGAMEEVGQTNVPELTYLTSAAYDDKDGMIVLAYCNDAGAGLYEIDPATAASAPIVEFEGGDEIVGMFIPDTPADKAPDTPALSITCTDGSQDINVSITLPTELYDGTDATGTPMHYNLYANNEEILSGDGVGGQTVETTKTLDITGMVDFYVTVSNEAGESKKAKTSLYVGKGLPSAPAGVALAYADGVFTLTWNAVTSSADGGYFDASAVKYDIVDSEGQTLASDLTDLSWTTTQAMPEEFTAFSFGVIAKFDNRLSSPAMSNLIYLGHYNAPLEMDLTDQAMFDRHSILDANNDGATWSYTNKGARYKYSLNVAGDDWLFSPAIYLEAGKAYDFSSVAKAESNNYPEHLEICLGSEPTADGMATTIVGKTLLTATASTLTGAIIPAVSGEYYLGFHAVSDAGMYYIYVSSYQISAPFGSAAPDAVTDLTVTPDIKGELKATVSFTTASRTVTGSDLTGDILVKLLRDGEEVASKTASAGAPASFEDNVSAPGRYTYTVASYTTDGQNGRTASASNYVGPNVPNPPAVVKAVETTGKLGELTLSWEHATEDVDGNPLYTPNLKYNVYIYDTELQDWRLLNNEPQTEQTFTFQATEDTATQKFVQIGVQTVNNGVEGEYLQGAGLIPVGQPYALPFKMSDANDLQTYIVGIDTSDGCKWGMGQDGNFSNVTSQDNDGYFFLGERTGSGLRSGDLILGKVDLATAQHPVLSFYTWKITETDKNTLDVFVVCDGETSLLKTLDYSEDMDDLWTKKKIDLSQFAGKSIQVILRYHSDGLVYFFLDNLRIDELLDYDLAATSISAPEVVNGGEEFDVTVDIANEGRLDAAEFTVQLLADGNVVAEQTVESLAADESTSVVFKQTLNMASAKETVYTAVVTYQADLNPDNNTTQNSAAVERAESTLPVVTNLTGEATDNGHLLTWDAIIPEELPADPVVEGFETGESFTQEFSGWTFHDVDGYPTGGFRNVDLPNHEEGVGTMSFIIMDDSHSELSASDFKAASGNKYIGAIYCQGEGSSVLPSDDWAISPLLNGKAQTVKFMCRNFSVNYTEKLQVWYTTENSDDPEDFVMLESFNTPGLDHLMLRLDKWKQFSFTLPAGALRFAFRVISDDGFMVMIDDVEYTSSESVITLQHIGYNVYRDGILLNQQPLTTNSYTTLPEDEADHTYHVTAVYDRGESEVSNPVNLGKSGVGETLAAAGVKIAVEGQQIIVSGAADNAVMIAAADGRVIYSGQGDAKVDVLRGIYLVCVGKTTAKVAVK